MGRKAGTVLYPAGRPAEAVAIPAHAAIRLNTNLGKKPRERLEYIIVHELAHIIEPTHNAWFLALMDQFIPKWQFYREQLNRLSVSHEYWVY